MSKLTYVFVPKGQTAPRTTRGYSTRQESVIKAVTEKDLLYKDSGDWGPFSNDIYYAYLTDDPNLFNEDGEVCP